MSLIGSSGDTTADWYRLGETSADLVRAIEERREARRQAKADEVARFEMGSPAYSDIDYAAELYAVRQAVLAELQRLDPANKLLDPNVRKELARQGLEAFVRNGRQDVNDAAIPLPR